MFFWNADPDGGRKGLLHVTVLSHSVIRGHFENCTWLEVCQPSPRYFDCTLSLPPFNLYFALLGEVGQLTQTLRICSFAGWALQLFP